MPPFGVGPQLATAEAHREWTALAIAAASSFDYNGHLESNAVVVGQLRVRTPASSLVGNCRYMRN